MTTTPERHAAARTTSSRTHRTTCVVRTRDDVDFVDVTDDVAAAVAAAGIRAGRVTVFTPSPGCSILANERESGLLIDLRKTIERLRMESPQRSPLLGSTSIVVPVVDRGLRLGRWQRLLLVELERAAERTIVVHVEGE
ncbi:MAG TPA: YjbQ family protein [Actinomycetota bacterium]|nr:YjbQ family protein [Actinomycetota bacterium]